MHVRAFLLAEVTVWIHVICFPSETRSREEANDVVDVLVLPSLFLFMNPRVTFLSWRLLCLRECERSSTGCRTTEHSAPWYTSSSKHRRTSGLTSDWLALSVQRDAASLRSWFQSLRLIKRLFLRVLFFILHNMRDIKLQFHVILTPTLYLKVEGWRLGDSFSDRRSLEKGTISSLLLL